MKTVMIIVTLTWDCSENMPVLLSGIANWEAGNYNYKISKINRNIASSEEVQVLIFINNGNIGGIYLTRGKLSFNEKGYIKFSINSIKSMKSIAWLHAGSTTYKDHYQYFVTQVYL